jgi:hypothetical protein
MEERKITELKRGITSLNIIGGAGLGKENIYKRKFGLTTTGD